MLAIVPRPPTSRPYFAYVGLGKKDVCTVEIHNSTSVDCRWWNVGEIDNGEFVRSEADSCMSQGAPSQNPHATWFLLMTPDDVDKRAYVISPKMQGGVSHLILSLWYAIKCDGSFLRAYVIRSIRDIRTVTSQSEYLLEIKGLKTTIHWKFESFQLAIPTNFETFHVVLEGFTPVNASCTGYLCYNNVDFVHPYPTKALVAIDKMSLELKHDQCNLTVKNQSHELDCRFQDSNNSFTYCTWTSFSPYGDIAYPEFNSWVGENSGDVIDDRHGATLEHLEGRGYILRFDGLGNTNSEHYLRSPKVVANSNCSCVMSFLYLLRGVWAPRLEVNLIYDDGTEDGLSVSHWSRHGHVSDNWETATALLNLQTGHSFQVEILVKDITDSKGDAHIDDLLF
uniref:MAM domain-containing protein n=1 Tax=Ciona intestinalis TaxID=7719 RepID=H2XXE3_CIOIN